MLDLKGVPGVVQMLAHWIGPVWTKRVIWGAIWLGVLIAAGIGAGHWMSAFRSPQPASSVVGAGNIVTFNQTGGVNTVNQAPPPELRCSLPTRAAATDKTFVTEVDCDVASPYPPAILTIIAEAPSIVSLDVQAAPYLTKFYSTTFAAGRATETIQSPLGRYRVVIRTKENERVNISHEFK